jgi:DNA end-binding protein Ku
MALRSMWSGALRINSLLQAQVAICKGSEPYRGKEELKELCECHHTPFTRQTVCEGGRQRLTEAMSKAGETDNTTAAVKGVETEGDEYLVLDQAALDAIARAGTSDTIELAAVIDAADAPMQRTSSLYYVRPDKKVKGAAGVLAVFFASLERTGKIAIGKWAPRGREQLVAIYPSGGALVLNVLMYESEIREPDETCLISADSVSDPEVEVATQLLDGLPDMFDFHSAEDSAVIVRREAIEAARKGEPIPTSEPSAQPEVVPDLMAALQAATKGTPVAKAKQTAAKNGKVPAGSAA